MSEYLEVYNLKNKLIDTLERKKFYDDIKKEFKRAGKITRKVKTIRVILMNSAGRIYLQKRSKKKAQNSGLYDKTIGGHVPAGYSFEMALIKECAEELGFAVAVISKDQISVAAKSTNLSVIGLLWQTEKDDSFYSVRKDKQGDFIQPDITIWYLGYYDGNLRFIDGEVAGLETFTLKELEKEIKDNPQNFTEDIKYAIKRFKKYLIPLKKV